MPRTRTSVGCLLAALMFVVSSGVRAADEKAEIEALKKDIEDLRKRLNATSAPARSGVERTLDNRYGPNATVSTKSGKLTIGGLTQIWFYAFQKDNRGLFDKADAGVSIPDTNEGQQNSSFRVRRAEIKFTMDIHENVTGVVMIDPAREATSFPTLTDNQATAGSIFKTQNQVSPEFDAANGPGLGNTSSIGGVQTGSGAVPRLLQDAYINYHGVIPHHDFQVGQFKAWVGEEGIRSSAQLDFAERSFLGQHVDNIGHDLGISAHGTWWEDRFQYWVGIFDGAGNYFGTVALNSAGGQQQNRADDNNEKDFNARALVRPLWKDCRWGSLELGGSVRMGEHGENRLAGRDAFAAPVNGLNREKTWATWYNAWLYYAPGGPVRGMWIRGEWSWIKDRNAPGTVVDLDGNGASSAAGFQQTNAKTMGVWGAYGAVGYKMSDSRWQDCDCSSGWLKNFEFVARIDMFQNVWTANASDPAVTDTFRTIVYTGGVNYYIKGHDAKIQANFNAMDNPEGTAAHHFHKGVHNDSFVMNFQVAF